MKLSDIPLRRLSPEDSLRAWLEVSILNPHTNKKVRVLGLIDTGADECALPAAYASILGHNLQKGKLKEVNTGNGKTSAYSHTVRIEIPGFATQDTLIDFLPNLFIPLLGVKSFLGHFVLTIDYPAKTFSLEKK